MVFTSFSTFLAVIQSYQEDGRVIMKGSMHGLGSDRVLISPPVGLDPTTP